jgi:hypothetical protein
MQSQPPEPPESYEFNADQERLLRSLARYLRAFGLLLCAGGGVALLLGFDESWHFFVQGALLLIIGVLSVQASVAFHKITTTRGNDIGLLMEALQNLRGIYAAQTWMIGFVLAVLAVIAALIWINPD